MRDILQKKNIHSKVLFVWHIRRLWWTINCSKNSTWKATWFNEQEGIPWTDQGWLICVRCCREGKECEKKPWAWVHCRRDTVLEKNHRYGSPYLVATRGNISCGEGYRNIFCRNMVWTASEALRCKWRFVPRKFEHWFSARVLVKTKLPSGREM